MLLSRYYTEKTKYFIKKKNTYKYVQRKLELTPVHVASNREEQTRNIAFGQQLYLYVCVGGGLEHVLLVQPNPLFKTFSYMFSQHDDHSPHQ